MRAALNRVLAEDVRSGINVPFRNQFAAMDGYALNGADIPSGGSAELRVLWHGQPLPWAGKPFRGRLDAGGCVRIMTGAIMPDGADTVIIRERTSRLSIPASA